MTDHETEIRRRICDPGHFIGKRGDDYTESIAFWGSRAVWAYVEPLLQPMETLLVKVVELRDDSAVLADDRLGLSEELRALAQQQWTRYANAATVLTEILQEQQGVMPDDDDFA